MDKYLAFFTDMNLDKAHAYLQLMRFDRPIGFLLLLWPTLVALWVAAKGFPSLDLLIIFTLGVVVMRSAGCVINDMFDRGFDGHVQRTRERPLVSGKVTIEEARMLFLSLLLVALVLLLLLNWQTFYWALAALGLTMLYPLAKRFTWFPQVVLGITFAWSIPMAFAATDVAVDEQVWLIYFTNLIWIVMYDTIYGIMDLEDDLKIGIRSTAILFGEADRMMIGLMQLMTLSGMLIVGASQAFNAWYYVWLIPVCSLFGWQQYLIRHREPAACLRAFLNNNLVGACWFIGVLGAYLTA